jgi:hypothetical protein
VSIFPRRIVQGLIDTSPRFLRTSQIRNLVKRLNNLADPNDAFAAEWELVVLSTFHGIGPIQHEPRGSGTRHPDLLFGPKGGVSFLADITAASDKGMRVSYPVEAFTAALRQKISERGLRGNSFGWELRNKTGALYRGGPRPALRLCPSRQFATRIFNRNFDMFMDTVSVRPDTAHEYLIDEPDLFVRILYDPHLQFSTGRHPAFEYFHSETQNPIFDKLEEKAAQLRGARLNVLQGIFLCDAGTSLLRARKSFLSYSIDEVVKLFLKGNPDVAFVAILTVGDERASNTSSPGHRVRVDLYTNPKQTAFAEALKPLMTLFVEMLPHPRHTPTNARLRLEEGEPNYKFCHFGGMKMMGRSLRMSTRTLLELLAGKMSIEDFTKSYAVDLRAPVNSFMQRLRNGQLITAISVHPQPDRDDDEVTIEFGDPDPAVSAFRMPLIARTGRK